MGIVFRQSVKSSIVIGVGALLGAVIIYLSTLIIPKTEFGLIRYFTNISAVASQVTMLGTNILLAIFVHRYDNDPDKKSILITACIVITVVTTAVLSLFYILFRQYITSGFQSADQPYISQFYYWLPIFVLLWGLLLLLEHYLNSQLKVAKSLFMREILLRILNLAVIGLYAMGWISFKALFILSILIYAVPVVVLYYLCTQTPGFRWNFGWKRIPASERKEIIHFAWYHMLMGISINLLGYLDSLMLAPLDKNGLRSVGEYAVAIYIITILQIPYRSMSSASLPDLTKSYNNKDYPALQNFFTRASQNVLLATTLLGLLIVFNMPNVVALLSGYEIITSLVLILIIGRFVDIASGLNNELISISKYYKFNFYLSLLLIVCIFVLNRIFIPIYGVYGAAWSNTIALSAFNICKIIFLWRKLGLQPFSKSTLYILLAGGLTAGLAWLMPYMSYPIADGMIRSTGICILFATFIIVFKASPDLNNYLLSIRQNKRLF